MIMRKDFIYTQTRLQARHGMRPDERTWGLVESQKDLANFLQSARQTSLSQWVSGLQATDNHHFIESTLFHHYLDYVLEVSAWVPSEWRKAVHWVVCLAYLPVIRHLLKGNTAYSWMLDDARTKLVSASGLEQRMTYFLQSEFAPLFKYWSTGDSLVNAWLMQWRNLWPAVNSEQKKSFTAFINRVQAHRTLFEELPIDRTWQQREKLVFKLTMMFRRYTCEPVNVFVHLLLVALDIERLRGDAIQRGLFTDYREMSA